MFCFFFPKGKQVVSVSQMNMFGHMFCATPKWVKFSRFATKKNFQPYHCTIGCGSKKLLNQK